MCCRCTAKLSAMLSVAHTSRPILWLTCSTLLLALWVNSTHAITWRLRQWTTSVICWPMHLPLVQTWMHRLLRNTLVLLRHKLWMVACTRHGRLLVCTTQVRLLNSMHLLQKTNQASLKMSWNTLKKAAWFPTCKACLLKAHSRICKKTSTQVNLKKHWRLWMVSLMCMPTCLNCLAALPLTALLAINYCVKTSCLMKPLKLARLRMWKTLQTLSKLVSGDVVLVQCSCSLDLPLQVQYVLLKH